MAMLDLCACYNWFTDTGEAEQVATTFVRDGVFDGPIGRFEGTEEIIRFNREVRERIAGSMHFDDNLLVEDRGDHVEHRCSPALHGVPSDDGAITVLQTYEIVKIDGEWKFRIRHPSWRVPPTREMPGMAPSVPPSHWSLGRGYRLWSGASVVRRVSWIWCWV
jgi:hypothetical protein